MRLPNDASALRRRSVAPRWRRAVLPPPNNLKAEVKPQPSQRGGAEQPAAGGGGWGVGGGEGLLPLLSFSLFNIFLLLLF